jgi:putative tricarboxylic transport membrane protein
MIDMLIEGFVVAFQPTNLAFIFLGVLLGQVIGALPASDPLRAWRSCFR